MFVTTKVRNNSHRLSGSNPLSRRAASALVETWQALERIVEGQCKAIGLSNINLEKLQEIVEAARIKPAVVEIESHPYLPEWDTLESSVNAS